LYREVEDIYWDFADKIVLEKLLLKCVLKLVANSMLKLFNKAICFNNII